MDHNDSQRHNGQATSPLVEDTRRVAEDVRHMVDTFRRENPIGQYYEQNPYAVLAAAAGVGYLLGGGLFTPFTRRLIRVGMKALVIPVAATQVKGMTQGGEFEGSGLP